MAAAAWDALESRFDDHAKSRARQSSEWNETAKHYRREATKAEANALQARRLRGNPEAYRALDMLLLLTLGAAAMGRTTKHDENERKLKEQVDAQESDA